MFRLCPKCQLDSALLNAPGQDIEPHQIHHGPYLPGIGIQNKFVGVCLCAAIFQNVRV